MKILQIFIILTSFSAFASDTGDEIAAAIRAGDAKLISTYFNANVDLTFGKEGDIYGKTQAESMVRDFFSKNKPKSFTLVHKGSSKEGTMFIVGTLVTENGKTYRTSYVLKPVQGKNLIQELRFENQ